MHLSVQWQNIFSGICLCGVAVAEHVCISDNVWLFYYYHGCIWLLWSLIDICWPEYTAITSLSLVIQWAHAFNLSVYTLIPWSWRMKRMHHIYIYIYSLNIEMFAIFMPFMHAFMDACFTGRLTLLVTHR